MAAPGVPILRLENPLSGYKVVIEVPTRLLGSVKAGAEAKLIQGDDTFPARVSRILPTASGQGGLAVFEIDVGRRPFGLPTGSYVGVDLHVRSPEGLILPSRALLQKKAVHVFMLDDQNVVEPVRVGLLGTAGDDAVVSGPLENGDRVAVANEAMLLRLAAGAVVQVKDGGS
jgi:hypothetical protein